MARTRTKLAVASAATAATLAVGLAVPAQSQAVDIPGGVANVVNCVELTVSNLLYATPGQPGCQLAGIVGAFGL